ncbi:MAG: N-acetyl-gamma-glutamyl-phosphate reductase [Candidatus Omnitrophota bacterium]
MKVKAAVIGATGFTGEELIRLLLGHPQAEITYISAKIDEEQKFSDIFTRFKGRLGLTCKNLNIKEAALAADIVFLAIPHRISLQFVPQFIKKKKTVIDLSADYRLKDKAVYQKYYNIPHTDRENLKGAVYGLCELYRDKIKKAKLIANPGCYPTVSALSLAPLIKERLIGDIIIDAKSGITGAGRKPALEYHYAHLNGNMFSYKPFDHQHTPEIDQLLSDISGTKTKVQFSPHVIPVERGILATIYARLNKSIGEKDANKLYNDFYKGEYFIRLLNQKLPHLKDVVGTNFCDIGLRIKGNRIVIVGVIDNLIKGASGQAIQNMNILCGFAESLGLQ